MNDVRKGPESLHSRLRTVDVARGVGYSVQQIRNLEDDGVLPPVGRTASGHRVFGEAHVDWARAYRALAAAVGPVEAKRVLVTAHRSRSETLALMDAAHAALDRQRHGLALARRAAEAIADEPMDRADPRDAMSVGELAEALGVRASTLRHWDAVGLVVPGRTVRGARRYAPDDVRDARIVHQLRLAGWRLDPLADLLPRLRGPDATVLTALADRDVALDARSAALLEAGGLVARLISPRP